MVTELLKLEWAQKFWWEEKNPAVSDKATLEEILCDSQERKGMSRKESLHLVPTLLFLHFYHQTTKQQPLF